jgi:cytoplasmic iron level regulating protein YaaA (DUF328/UPF0246 family)
MIDRLVKIANMLDEIGMFDEADILTDTTKKLLPDDFESVELSKANLAEAVANQVMDYFSQTSNADFLKEYRGQMEEVASECYRMIDLSLDMESNVDRCISLFEKKFRGMMERVSSVKIVRVAGFVKEEEHHEENGEPDFEYDMAKNELSTAMDAIEDLLSILGDDTEGELPAWVQSKITKGVDYLDSVADYMKGENQKTAATKKKKNPKLNSPFRTPGGPKKFSVYVKNDKGNIVKVNFGDPNMKIKSNIPGRRKNFRARHNCENPGSKTKARYWSCRQWSDSASNI